MGSAPETLQKCDLLIGNGYVITVDANRTVFPHGAVAITGKEIVAVGPESQLRKRFNPRHIIDAGGAAVHPGFVEPHCHATMHSTRGAITDNPDAFADPGNKLHQYALWFNKLKDEDEWASSLHASAEMLLNGFTCMVEAGTVFEPDICAKAAEAVGIRASLADPFLWDLTDGTAMTQQIARAPCNQEAAARMLGSQLWRNKDVDSLVRGHVAIYGLGSASDELTLAAKRAAEGAGVAMIQHQSMAIDDANLDKERFGKSPLVHFAEIGAISTNTAFVHMNIVRDDEVEPIAASGMSIIWHPGNYQFYGIALAQRTRAPELVRRGVNICLCTDVAKIWTFGEMARIGYLVAREEGAYLACEQLLEMQTINAARATCLDTLIGSLEPGKRADLVIRRQDVAEAQPGLDVIRELTLVCGPKSVDTVIVDGRVVVRHGRLTLADEARVFAESRESAHRVAHSVGLLPGTIWPHVT